MKLEEAVKYLKDSDGPQQLCIDKGLVTDPDDLLIYMEKAINLASELSFFSIQETEDDLIFNKDGVQYIQLFPAHYAVDLIESDLDLLNKGLSDLQIAHRLLDYRINDA
ncbi:hypothetical protein GO755_19690 [Spirosoma sp. HMF4905]|uniref:Uncharacterized protein n=1 Tax=Spirosoma arboris TaxID=2682092 RepID=A0A7K1SEP5_9BACT|nr:hypothetical protein [Spirosoma arboris]MVM32279.1 hypothetical protein [Spirosoma arboris]